MMVSCVHDSPMHVRINRPRSSSPLATDATIFLTILLSSGCPGPRLDLRVRDAELSGSRSKRFSLYSVRVRFAVVLDPDADRL
jgi:hypothetical protein